MKTFNYRGTTINEININDFDQEFEDLGIDPNTAWSIMGDGESDLIYVSNGFLRALKAGNNEDGEWHHYFVKENDFEAEKINFNDKVNRYGL